MKAWVLRAVNDIRLEESSVPVPSPGEVLVRVRACGICGSDIPRVYNMGAHKMPLIIGHEFSGEVEGVGMDVDHSWLKRHVGVIPLIPCGRCRFCRRGTYEMCRDYDYLGSRRDGAFAEYVTVPENNLIELPEEISFEAAAMLEPMAVAVHAMRIGVGDAFHRLPTDAKIAVCGLGTIGLLLTAFLQDAGYRNLYLIGNKKLQKRKAEEFGIDGIRYFDSAKKSPSDWLQDHIGGVDLYFECVGRNETITYGIEGTAPGGRIVIVGNPYTDMNFSRDEWWRILRNQLAVSGAWNSSFMGNDDDWHYVLNRLAEGRIQPKQIITHRLNLDELSGGLRLMRDKMEDYCKVMIVQ